MDQKKLWNQIWNRDDRLLSNNFAKRSFSEIKNKPLISLLDIGCGIGVDSIFFAQNGLKVTAVDFSESGIRKFKQTIEHKKIKNIILLQEDISDFKFPPNSFDVVYAHLSLHYFDDQTTTKIFNRLYKILKPKGLFFIKCKSTDDHLYGRGKKIEKDMYLRQGHIRHFFSKEYMAEKLKKFRVLKIRKTSSTYHTYKSFFIEAAATK
ncbi:MAG: methyltransferase domain-containing protein [Candidatus Nealsonbacteria bacterium]|nr:methyltransferase domain-containing protein [Candidatus Nealsonbacteria bacterium]